MPKYNDFDLDLQSTTPASIDGLRITTGKDSINLSCIPSCGPMCSTATLYTIEYC